MLSTRDHCDRPCLRSPASYHTYVLDALRMPPSEVLYLIPYYASGFYQSMSMHIRPVQGPIGPLTH
eukprot:2955010-Pleurochrysis_carterae.AAC.2